MKLCDLKVSDDHPLKVAKLSVIGSGAWNILSMRVGKMNCIFSVKLP